MNITIKIVVIFGLVVLAMYCIEKLVKSVFNLIVLYKASKYTNHSARVRSNGIVLNKKTKKLEACGEKIILPFD